MENSLLILILFLALIVTYLIFKLYLKGKYSKLYRKKGMKGFEKKYFSEPTHFNFEDEELKLDLKENQNAIVNQQEEPHILNHNYLNNIEVGQKIYWKDIKKHKQKLVANDLEVYGEFSAKHISENGMFLNLFGKFLQAGHGWWVSKVLAQQHGRSTDKAINR